MTRTRRLARDACLGIALLAAAGCGGGSSSSTGSSQTPANFDFGGNSPTKATAFGDSITVGVLELKRRDLRLTTANNYPALLQGKLQGLDPAWRVINRGRSGEHTFEGVGRLPSVLASDKPGFVLILEGTNDAEACLDAGVATNNLRNMVRIARTNQSIPIIGTVPPSFRNNPCADNIIDTVNSNIRGFASAENVHGRGDPRRHEQSRAVWDRPGPRPAPSERGGLQGHGGHLVPGDAAGDPRRSEHGPPQAALRPPRPGGWPCSNG